MKPQTEPSAASSSELPGFETVKLENLNEHTLTTEDVESRKTQLWLIKVPYEFDVSNLSGTTVILNGSQDLTIKQTDEMKEKKYESRASKYKKNESCDLKVVVPAKSKGCLNVAKDFSGHMDIIRTVKVPMLNYPPAQPPMYTDIPKGLKARWKPFGHRTPPKIKERHKTTVEEGDKPGQKRKLKDQEKSEKNKSPKKKKKTKDESGYISSMPLEESGSSTKHKKKKKKKTLDVLM